MSRSNEQQDTDIDNLQNRMGDKVEMGTLLRIISIIIVVVISLSGWVVAGMNALENKVDINTQNVSDVQGDIKAIKTDVGWLIKEYQKDPQTFRRNFNSISKK